MNDNWKHRTETRQCASCISFVPKQVYKPTKSGNQQEEDSVVGRCRRHSPTHEGYPVVIENDWCGDYKLDESKI